MTVRRGAFELAVWAGRRPLAGEPVPPVVWGFGVCVRLQDGGRWLRERRRWRRIRRGAGGGRRRGERVGGLLQAIELASGGK
ncbi:hypothetical protein chiPu_0013077 [Chiloscyllium punctatum]|uniref:Uncharacterized protein n=1 Tax=Chiloscyllium punctatum TaxID=137246 RepID=A0A401SW25_CHIPU|nr:hypothetical protein [Chiloscyllium punctatum]